MLIPNLVARSGLTALCDLTAMRFALNGVELRRDADGHPRATVTDGRRLLTVEWTEPAPADYPPCINATPQEGFCVLIDRRDWGAAAKMPPRKSPKAILLNVAVDESMANGELTMGATDLATVQKIAVKPIEGRFPKWDDCLPKYRAPECVRIGIDPSLLASTLKVLGALTGADAACVTMSVPINGEGAVLLEATGDNGNVRARGAVCQRAIDRRLGGDAVKDFRAASVVSDPIADVLCDICSPDQLDAIRERLAATA